MGASRGHASFPKCRGGVGGSETRMPRAAYGRARWWGRKGCPTQHRQETPLSPTARPAWTNLSLGATHCKDSCEGWCVLAPGRPNAQSRESRGPLRAVARSSPTLCRPRGLQHARLPCPSPTPRAYSNSCPLTQ